MAEGSTGHIIHAKEGKAWRRERVCWAGQHVRSYDFLRN